MKNPKLHYLGILLVLIGVIITSGGIYFGSAPQFHSSLSEQSTNIIIGIIPLVAGVLMWLFFDE